MPAVMAPLSFDEEWFGPESCEALAGLVCEVEGLKGDIVEIGAWQGRSTLAMAQATRRIVNTVDTWNGSPGEVSAELAAGRDVHAEFLANLEAAEIDNVVAWRMDWRQYFTTHFDPLKLVFIDAEHTYVEVRDTIETVRPLLVPGGIICGDDAHHPPVQRAIVDTLGNAERVATLWVWRS